VDAGANSFMMYKDADETDSLLYAGPIWDFDLFVPMSSNSGIHRIYAGAKIGGRNDSLSGGLLYHLLKHEDFQSIVREEYFCDVLPAVNRLLDNNYFDSLQALIDVDSEEMSAYLRERSDFLSWLWKSDTTDVVCVQVINSSQYERAISIFGTKTSGVRLPLYPVVYNHDPELTWHLAGNSTPLPYDTVFYTNQQVEMHFREPTPYEVQIRRIKKKLRKMF